MDEPFSRHLSQEDRDAIAAELERLGYEVERPAAARPRLPSWLRDREDDDGTEGFGMLGHGLDDEP